MVVVVVAVAVAVPVAVAVVVVVVLAGCEDSEIALQLQEFPVAAMSWIDNIHTVAATAGQACRLMERIDEYPRAVWQVHLKETYLEYIIHRGGHDDLTAASGCQLEWKKVDVMTGIIWSNLAMAVVPAATAQGKFYLSPNAGPSALAGKGCNPLYFNVAWQNDNLHEAAGAYANDAGHKNSFIHTF